MPQPASRTARSWSWISEFPRLTDRPVQGKGAAISTQLMGWAGDGNPMVRPPRDLQYVSRRTRPKEPEGGSHESNVASQGFGGPVDGGRGAGALHLGVVEDPG